MLPIFAVGVYRIINDILDIEKLESGMLQFDLRRVDARSVAEHAIDANSAYSDSLGVRVRLDACTGDTAVLADADRLTQVLVNLLSNAAKFSRHYLLCRPAALGCGYHDGRRRAAADAEVRLMRAWRCTQPTVIIARL